MLTRKELLTRIVDDCIKECYILVQPAVTWDEFTNQCEEYSKNYKEWENFNKVSNNKEKNPEDWKVQQELHPEWVGKSDVECIGPKPFEFYYLPAKVLENLTENYVYTYKLDDQQSFLDDIQILKDYFENPVLDKYIKNDSHSGHRGYTHPDNLIKEINKILNNFYGNNPKNTELVIEIYNKVIEFFNMAANFFKFTRELNTFNMNIFLGPSPSSNKQAVIDNWKKYRNQDIEIDESKYNNDDEI